ncbi:MAG: SDR family oxidoreductase [Acidimicrobiia bacterium]|nr:SDR family oxidoreductase [Acidimicrobiia bacterium]
MTISIDLHRQRAVVTGSGAGIGREIARWLARAGASVAVIDARPDPAAETAALIEGEGGSATVIVGDARDDARLQAMIGEAADSLGGLDIAVNNIGMMGPQGSAPWLAMTPGQLRDVFDQNLVITAVAAMIEAQILVEAGGGVMLNVTSGETTRPAPNMAGYGAAKAAINHLTQTLAVELGPSGVRVNAIAPGTTLTETVEAALPPEHYRALVEATPLRRGTEPDELARLAVFLCSDLARCITGQFFLADAGAHLSRSRPANRPTA